MGSTAEPMAYPARNPLPPIPRGFAAAQLKTTWIGEGDEGARQTLRLMRKIVRQALKDPTVLERAVQVITQATPHDQLGELRAIRSFLTKNVRYVNDPESFELLRQPDYQLDRIAAGGMAEGDCDDVAILGATLALAIGRPARFVAVGFGGEDEPFSHVWAETLVDGFWRELDTTRPIGATALRPTRRMELEV